MNLCCAGTGAALSNKVLLGAAGASALQMQTRICCGAVRFRRLWRRILGERRLRTTYGLRSRNPR